MSNIFRTAERLRQKTTSYHGRTRMRQEGFKLVKVYKKGKPVMTKVPIQQPFRKQDK